MQENQARKLVVSEWITLDGVFDADTLDTWFMPFDSEARAQAIKEGIDQAGALLLGRVTYEMLAAYWPNLKNDEMGVAARLNALPKHVVTSRRAPLDWSNARVLDGAPAEAVARLKQQPGGDLLMFGSGTLARALMLAGLIDEYRFFVHPVMMGSGKRFFTDGVSPARLDLTSARQLDSGVMLLSYRPGQ